MFVFSISVSVPLCLFSFTLVLSPPLVISIYLHPLFTLPLFLHFAYLFCSTFSWSHLRLFSCYFIQMEFVFFWLGLTLLKPTIPSIQLNSAGFFFCFLALALYFWFSPLPRVCVCVLLCSNWNVSGTRRATLWIFSCIYAVWKISSCVRCAVCVCAIIIYQQPAWKQARILRLSNICKCAHTHSRH